MGSNIAFKDVNKFVDKWASIFATIGSTNRLAILLILHGSMYTRGKHCLTYSEIRDILGYSSETTVIYHLEKLMDADLVKKEPTQDEKGKGRVYPLYSVTQKWIDFVEESGLKDAFLEYVKQWRSS